jgi:CheY-like chemotaxis protein/AraC-like DNA-binding protein
MDSFEQFKEHLREALNHLHDPDYAPPAVLCAMIGCDAGGSPGPLQANILRLIDELRPSSEVSQYPRARQDYDLLHDRFVLRLTQEETAERLHMSVRSVRRAQRIATHTLAQLLWEHGLARQAAQEAADPLSDEEPLDRRAQVRQELSALLTQSPGAIADVGQAVSRAVDLERVLGAQYEVSLRVLDPPADLMAEVHPAFLRQVLIMALGDLIRYAAPGEIALRVVAVERDVVFELAADRVPEETPPNVELIEEMLSSQRGRVEVEAGSERLLLRIRVPRAGRITVLVVDDNQDQVHFYRRATAGTRYHIVHVPYGQRSAEQILALDPDAIVLDILLPDVDGWELLADLQAHPAGASVPVLICSIIREEDLAKALGADLYLAKPVHHREFIEGLARVLDRDRAGPTKS